MQTLIRNKDLKTLAQGASVVAAVGLMMGAALHPNLRGADELAGPRIQLPGAGQRAVDYVSDLGVSVYRGRIPDYVTGSDANRPPPVLAATTAEPQDTGDVVVFTEEPAADPARMTQATWQDEPRQPPVYPSVSGGGRYEADPG